MATMKLFMRLSLSQFHVPSSMFRICWEENKKKIGKFEDKWFCHYEKFMSFYQHYRTYQVYIFPQTMLYVLCIH